mgnify:CR=1 FL=1
MKGIFWSHIIIHIHCIWLQVFVNQWSVAQHMLRRRKCKSYNSCSFSCTDQRWVQQNECLQALNFNYWTIAMLSSAELVSDQYSYRMHCKMFTVCLIFTVRHNHVFKSCLIRWPLIGLRNLILIGQLRIWWKQTKAFFHTLATVNNLNTECYVIQSKKCKQK